jgi:hypothetical protein
MGRIANLLPKWPQIAPNPPLSGADEVPGHGIGMPETGISSDRLGGSRSIQLSYRGRVRV